METNTPTNWSRCSNCKKEIPFSSLYYLCSVSTCRHKRTGLKFCSVPCWDAHLGYANHRESWAEEARSPSKSEFLAELKTESSTPAQPRSPIKKVISPSPSSPSSPATAQAQALPPVETLVVVSRVKDLINQQSQFNTSQCCIDALTKVVLTECLRGIEKAKLAGRRTVMGRDINT